MEEEQAEIEGVQKEEAGETGQQHSAQGFSKREEEHASTPEHVDGVVDAVVVEVGDMV